MRVLIAPDKFKGSLSALQAAQAMERGVRAAMPDAAAALCPLADGGEGTVEALVSLPGGRSVRISVTDPLGDIVEARFGVIEPKSGSTRRATKTAVIESALASGLSLVPPAKRNPMITTSFGTGELIQAALNEGCERVIVGIGGSATTDGGMGMAQALGVVFLDAAGVEIGLGSGQYLSDIADIDLSGLDERIGKTEFIIASDVRNPLCGPDGAAYVYGPQKGATPEMVKRLDAGLANYAAVIEEKTDRSVKNSPGAGAAGGLGAGLMAFLGAQMQSGVEVIMDAIDFDRRLKGVDLVLTGEGRIDGQTLYGKVVSGVAGRAKSENIRVIAIAGEVTADAKPLLDKGVSDMHQFVRPNMTYEYAISHAGELLEEETAEILAEME